MSYAFSVLSSRFLILMVLVMMALKILMVLVLLTLFLVCLLFCVAHVVLIGLCCD